MRAIRSSDGAVYAVDGRLPSHGNVTLELLHAVLSELSSIPVNMLIVMHPSGRQVDRESLHALVAADTASPHAGEAEIRKGTIYLFDRELLDVDLDSQEGRDLLASMELDLEAVLADVGHDPDKQLEASLDMIACIRNQRDSLTAAVLNLERHRGGRQEAINAYTHFASPLLTTYRELLAVYPSAMFTVGKVRVSPKMQVGARNGETPKERKLADYVSRDKMESVKDGCRKILDEIERKNEELESILRSVVEGTEQLKMEGNANSLDDLEECERDAREAHQRLSYLFRIADRSSAQEDELRELLDDTVDRLKFLVERKNAETIQLLATLQRVAALQSQIAATPSLISALNSDLRTKCDGFKHLSRLQLLLPSYVATLAEAIRRKAFAKLLSTSSRSFAEAYSKFSNDETKRRGIYQVEWSGKLPWETPGLDEGTLSVEVELRSSGPERKEQRPDSLEPTMEDLEALGKSLEETEEMLTPGDMPAGRVVHPIRDALLLIAKLRRQIESMQNDFEKLTSRLDDSAESEVTSVNVSAGDNSALKALEEQRMELERDLQSERSAREQDVAELTMKNAAVQRACDELEQKLADKEAEAREGIDRAAAAEQRLVAKNTELEAYRKQMDDDKQSMERKLSDLTLENSRLQQENRRLTSSLATTEGRVEDLLVREATLMESVADKERELRDYRTEAELDHATLEEQLAERDRRFRDLQAQTDLQTAKHADATKGLQMQLSEKAEELSRVTATSREQEKLLEDQKSSASRTQSEIIELLAALRCVMTPLHATINTFAVDKIPMAPVASSSAPPAKDTQLASLTEAVDLSMPSTTLQDASWRLRLLNTRPAELAQAKMQACLDQTKKWQKECKKYKERADRAVASSKEKLSFRSFRKGDLALFLPWRDSPLQTFAAFNYCRPNYFLMPTGVIGEQMKTREYIVARIVNITDAVVESDTPADNPYSLSLGSKFFRVEAEVWRSQSSTPAAAKASASAPQDIREVTAQAADTSAVAGDVSRDPDESVLVGSPMSPPPAGVTRKQASRRNSELDPLTTRQDDAASSEEAEENARSTVERKDTSKEETPSSDATTKAAGSDDPGRSAPQVSSLSAQRPARLDPVVESPVVSTAMPQLPLTPTKGVQEAAVDPSLLSVSAGEASPAFLPRSSAAARVPSRIVRSSTTPRLPGGGAGRGGAFPRSYSSNESTSSTNRRMRSSGFLRSLSSPKAPPTISTSLDAGENHNVWASSGSSPTPSSSRSKLQTQATTQTLGRYMSKRSSVGDGRRQSSTSAAAVSESSAADLLRSFTDSI